MPACVINVSTIIPDCDALKSIAGVRNFGWFCRRVDITGYTRATDGTITGFTIPTGKLKKFETQKFQNSGAFGVAASTIGKTRFSQTYLWRIYYSTQADRNAMEALILAEDIVIFSPNNDNQIEVYGAALGLAATTVTGGTGTKLDDDNTALLTFTGAEPSLPSLFNTIVSITATSGAATTNSTALAVVSAAGIVVGQSITGTGIPAGTTVTAIAGTTLTLSAPATVASGTTLTLGSDDKEAAFQANQDYLDTQVGP